MKDHDLPHPVLQPQGVALSIQQYPISSYEEYVQRWRKALKFIGTPLALWKFAEVVRGEVRIDNIAISVAGRAGGAYNLRRELMAQQKPYEPLQPVELYPGISSYGCGLCEELLRGYDFFTSHQSFEGSNFIALTNDVAIVPNRYPALIGHGLVLARHHDKNLDRRLKVAPGFIDPNELRQLRTSSHRTNKLAANPLNEQFFHSTALLADTLNLIAFRNHPLDGMSIPYHDHFHLTPFDAETFSALVSHRHTPIRTQSCCYELTDTPFSTLVIEALQTNTISALTSSISNRLNEQGIVHHIGYFRGRAYISPRRSDAVNRSLTLGATPMFHFIDPTNGEKLSEIEETVPRHGEFDWRRYIPASLDYQTSSQQSDGYPYL